MNEKKKWYKTWWGVLFIIFVPYIGIPIVLLQNRPKKAVSIIFMIFALIIIRSNYDKNGTNTALVLGISLLFFMIIKLYYFSKEKNLKSLIDKYNNIFKNEILEKEKLNTEISNLKTELANIELQKNNIDIEIANNKSKNNDLHFENENLTLLNNNLKNDNAKLTERMNNLEINLSDTNKIREEKILAITECENIFVGLEKLKKQETNQKNKISNLKELYKATQYAIDKYYRFFPEEFNIKFNKSDAIELEIPTISLNLHSMDVKELRKAYKDNAKLIDETFNRVIDRYSSKTNIMVYRLMVIALKSELQNVLYNLKYDKLDKAIEQIKEITNKYMNIAIEGNQSIVSTVGQFIGVLEYLFINAAKIEYNYYIRQEQIKQEQIALRQQLKEEAEERKALKLEQERIEKEELKFKQEIERTRELINNTQNNEELEALKQKILELQGQLSNVIVQKDEISNLQNGKAGNIYIISNLGAFGDKMFKIGMTRRLDPQERINELGSASVPFKFDVHSFIFSENAVELEKEIHNRLTSQRVNKVNMRKEFFYSTVDELEELVNELDPTAEFNKTMLAEEYNQTISYSIENEMDNLDWE